MSTPTPAAPVSVDDVRDYLEDAAVQWDDDQLGAVLAAEYAAQTATCRIPSDGYPADLREALMRRVAGNLARRGVPLGVLQGDAELGSSTYVAGRDPEVRRLEGPHRRMVVA